MASSNPARLWGLATASLLTQLNEQDHALLGGGPPGPGAMANRLEALARDWEAGTRQGLLEALAFLARAGHRKAFNDACILDLQTTATLEPWETIDKKITDKDQLRKIAFTRRHRARVGSRSLLAWDAGRLVTIAGWGYLAGLLSEDEAWSYIVPMAQAVQRTYASWDELGKHYMLGHEFWSGSWDGELARCQLALLDAPASPWRALPWGLDLGQHGLAVPLQPITVEPPPPPQPLLKKAYDPLAEKGAASSAPPAAGGRSVIGVVIGVVAFLVVAGVGASVALGFIRLGGAPPSASAVPSASASAVVAPAAPPASHASAAPSSHAAAPAQAAPHGAGGAHAPGGSPHAPPAPAKKH